MLTFAGLFVALTQWLLLAAMPGTASRVAADFQNNFYITDAQHALVKMDSTGNTLFRFRRHDVAPASMDVTNPFKLLLYYNRTQTVVFLDNTLSQTALLELQPVGFTQAQAVCRSADEKIWLFDGEDFQLKKLDYDGTVLLEGTDLMQQTGIAPGVDFMVEHDQKVYLNDSAHGIVVTDLYGNYEKTLALKGLRQFQFLNGRLVYFTKSAMMFYDWRTAQTDSVTLEGVGEFDAAAYGNDRLMTVGRNGLSLYRRTSP